MGRLDIHLEAQVVNAHSDNPESAPGQEVIYNGSIQDGEDPILVVQGPDDTAQSSSEGHILVVWKLSAFLIRPRLRLQNPSVVFAATAYLKPVEQVHDATLKEEYLPSQVPSGINLLEVAYVFTSSIFLPLQKQSPLQGVLLYKIYRELIQN